MTKEALKLALEALETPWNAPYVDGCDLALGKRVKAITAIKESLANEALEKMAENARELGLDYEPEWTPERIAGMARLKEAQDKKLAQPEQEPVANGKLKVTLQDTPTEIELSQYKKMLQAACADLGAINDALGIDPNDGGAEPIILAIEELKGRSQEPMAWMVYTLDGTSVCVTDNPSSFTPEHRALPLYTTPPQRTWVGLTDEEREEIALEVPIDAVSITEAKLKEKNK